MTRTLASSRKHPVVSVCFGSKAPSANGSYGSFSTSRDKQKTADSIKNSRNACFTRPHLKSDSGSLSKP